MCTEIHVCAVITHTHSEQANLNGNGVREGRGKLVNRGTKEDSFDITCCYTIRTWIHILVGDGIRMKLLDAIHLAGHH